MQEKPLPCPFCGSNAKFPEIEDVIGTYYEYECCCGLSSISLQISEYMSINERIGEVYLPYPEKYIERVRKIAIERWNTRVKVC